eukprot:362084-Chlamydomonas_euryale.AAC.3
MYRHHAARSYSRAKILEGTGDIILRVLLFWAFAFTICSAANIAVGVEDLTPTNGLIALHQAKANYIGSISGQRSTRRRT